MFAISGRGYEICPLWVKSRHVQSSSACPLRANSGHCKKKDRLAGGPSKIQTTSLQLAFGLDYRCLAFANRSLALAHTTRNTKSQYHRADHKQYFLHESPQIKCSKTTLTKICNRRGHGPCRDCLTPQNMFLRKYRSATHTFTRTVPKKSLSRHVRCESARAKC